MQLIDYLGRSKGDQPKISSFINDEVIWFKVADHNLLAHEVLEEENQGSSVELGVSCAEKTDFSDRVVEAFSVYILSNSENRG